MRPSLRFLDDALVSRILDEARDLLATLGVEVHNDAATELLLAHGARKDERGRVLVPAPVVDRALASAPHAVRLFDALGSPDARARRRRRLLHARLGGHPRPRRRDGPHPDAHDHRLRPLLEARGRPAAPRRAVDRPRPGRRARRRPGLLPAVPLASPRREAGGDRRLRHGGLRGDARPAARGARDAGRPAGAPALRLLLLPDRAPQVELRDEPERDRLRARRHPGGVRLDAARRLRRPGDARGQRRAARGGDALRRRAEPARLGRARRSSGAARPPSSTSGTRRRRWAPSRR